MMTKALISIIIPTNNSEKTLKNCIDSIIAQTYLRKEILVIDNASTDNTVNILKRYSENYTFIKWISEPDKGIYDAMNKGIQYSTGTWLYFLGSDDTLYDEKVLSVVSETLLKKESMVVYGDVWRNGGEWADNEHKYDGKFDLNKLLMINISHQAIFYHKSIFAKIGNYNLKYSICADYDFNLKCFASYKFDYIDIIIANFKFGGKSTQTVDKVFMADKNKNIIHYFFKQLFTTPFVDYRICVQEVAFSKSIDINIGVRLYCVLAYIKLKTQSLFK